MKTTHTPGPWEADLKTGDVSGTRNGATRLVARACDEIEANARLIAASPDLLGALEMASQIIHDLPNDEGDDYLSEACRKARAAIDKATGKAVSR